MLASTVSNSNNSNQRVKNACESCKVFRRKCDGELPSCHRCRQKGIECLYPPKLQKPHRKGRKTEMIIMKNALEVAVSLKEKHPDAIENIFTQAGIVELLDSQFNELQQDALVRLIQDWNVINFANLTLEIPRDAGNDEQPVQVAFLDFYFAKVYPLFPFFEKRWFIDNLNCIPVELLHLMYTVCLIILSDLPQVSL